MALLMRTIDAQCETVYEDTLKQVALVPFDTVAHLCFLDADGKSWVKIGGTYQELISWAKHIQAGLELYNSQKGGLQ